jgi:UV DNA damage endonuclease
MVRIGLCCTFLEQPIKLRTTTVKYASGLDPDARRTFLNVLLLHNARTLDLAIAWCADNGIGAFRINSDLLPLRTHPVLGYGLDSPECAGLRPLLEAAGARAKAANVRLSFHPDQFVVPGSANPKVVESSLQELEAQAEVAELVGAEQLTIHGGGAQGGEAAALERLRVGLERLSPRARSRVVLENDDTVYTVEDLLPLCRALGVPLVYDVHHHRCNPDTLSVEEATEQAAATGQGREPWAHLSSPIDGWAKTKRDDGNPRAHADYIDPKDLPACWLGRTMTIDIEAKAKELAVVKLAKWVATAEAKSAAAPSRPKRSRGTVSA